MFKRTYFILSTFVAALFMAAPMSMAQSAGYDDQFGSVYMPVGKNVLVIVNDWNGAMGSIVSHAADIQCGILAGTTSRVYQCTGYVAPGTKFNLEVKAANASSKIGAILDPWGGNNRLL